MRPVQPDDPRVADRASDAPPEERQPGAVDPAIQAAAILADSDERQESREETGGEVEHRVGGEEGSLDR
jgi:hypothetical protein